MGVSPEVDPRGRLRPLLRQQAGSVVLALLPGFFSCTAAATAQEVILRSANGGVELAGRYVGYDGELITLQTRHGDVSVRLRDVTCVGEACPVPQTFVEDAEIAAVPGAGTELLPTLIRGFAASEGYDVREQPQGLGLVRYALVSRNGTREVAALSVRLGSAEENFARYVARDAQFVVASREISEPEALQAREAGLGDVADRGRVLALDALVPVVAPGAAVPAIAPSQLASALRGELTVWQEISGGDLPVRVHLVDPSLGWPGGGVVTSGRIADSVVRHADPRGVQQRGLTEPGALGLVPLSGLERARVMPLAMGCGRRLQATPERVKAEDYPLTLPIMLYGPAWRLGAVLRRFAGFLETPEAQLAALAAGYVDLAPVEIPPTDLRRHWAEELHALGDPETVERLRALTERLGQMRRMSISFRFQAGKTELDALSRANVELLAAVIRRGGMDGRAVLLVGFSDSAGEPQANLRLSGRRAETVRDAVVQAVAETGAATPDLEALGVGEALPIACHEDRWGHQVNRRVEVWVSALGRRP